MSQKILYILYNADGTLMGKIRYGYRKLSSSGPDSPCAACDITHGGLSLTETGKWTKVKQEIEGQQIKVIQWHRDEINDKMKAFVRETSLRYPAVVFEKDETMKTIMTSTDLNAYGGDADALLTELVRQGIVAEKKSIPSSL